MKIKRPPVDITTNEKLRDYLLQKINLFIELEEVGFMVFNGISTQKILCNFYFWSAIYAVKGTLATSAAPKVLAFIDSGSSTSEIPTRRRKKSA
ncbi:MAG: hypothetical protein ACXVPD_15245 [Bacteroidia bacterium]